MANESEFGEACTYKVNNEGTEEVMIINCEACPQIPSLEENPVCMMRTVDKLSENQGVSRIIFRQKRFYNYSFEQTQLLMEIAKIYSYLIKSKRALSLQALGLKGQSLNILKQRHALLQYILLNLMRTDPIGSYVELKRTLREQYIIRKRVVDPNQLKDLQIFIDLLEDIEAKLEKTELVQKSKPFLDGYRVGDRGIYNLFFHPTLTPDFMFTQLMAKPPIDAEQLDVYKVGDADVTIFSVPYDIKPLYHLNPPEFKISEDKYALIDLAKTVLVEHKPKEEEFMDPAKMRKSFTNIGKDLLRELAEYRNLDLKQKEIEELAQILVRHTIGFGLMELILNDEKVQDVTINAPMGQTPIFVLHQDFDECFSNIIPTQSDGESWATKFRLLSGRPFDEANPILDTELKLPSARSRVAIVGRPLNPYGTAYSFRRHRDDPWTLPLFVKNRMICPLAAGMLSFLIDGARTMIIAGTRSSGKCVGGDTLIQLDDGSIVPISTLAKTESVEKEKSYSLQTGIISLDGYKIRNASADALYKRKVATEVIKIRTQSGKEIITTPEHPYFTFNNGIKEIFAENIKEGDFIASPRILFTKSKEAHFQFDTAEDGKYFLFKGKTNSLKFTFPKKLSTELAEFLGYVSGDGHISPVSILFFNNNEKIRANYKQLIKNLFNINYREFKTRTTVCIRISSRNLARLVSSTFNIPIGKKSSTLQIPQQILQSDNKVLAAYIRSLFDCDSYAGKRGIEFSSASEALVKQLQIALLRFGITSFKKQKAIHGRNYYSLFIWGEFVKNYIDHINFCHPKKKKSLAEFSIGFKTNVDVIPLGNGIFRELMLKLHISPKQLRVEARKDYWGYQNDLWRISRSGFRKIVEYFNNRYDKLASMNVQPLSNLAEYNQQEVIAEINRLKEILDVPYTELALLLGISDSNLRKILQGRSKAQLSGSISGLAGAYKLFDTYACNSNFCYAKMSRATNVPETSLKSYFYGGISPPPAREIAIGNFLEGLKQEQEKAKAIIKSLRNKHDKAIIGYAQAVMLLALLREGLNISNEAIASKEVSLATVSNFFNGKFKDVSIHTLIAITKNILTVYEEATSKETAELLTLANKLADSDIFWDKVTKVERIKPKDEYVYDLSVPGTHNFVGNGIIAHNTSLLGACLVEIMRKYRIISIEDTLELPTESLRNLGYNIQPLLVRSALLKGGTELSAEEGIRTSLRMGDSALIVGEVRSQEALALYEAMRVGALANVVAGTIHGDSPYGVYDRVVNDLKVPKTSFKATNIIVVANPLKSPDGLHKWRRVTQITEVRKTWTDDPLAERGFVDLMRYNAKTDQLEPTDDLINGDSEVIKDIGGNIKEWAGNWDAIWDNIILRANMKNLIVDYAAKANMPSILEAPFVVQANDHFHRLAGKIKDEVGWMDSKRILYEWEELLKRNIKKSKIR